MGPVAVFNHSVASADSVARVLLWERDDGEAERILSQMPDSGLQNSATVAGSAAELENALRSREIGVVLLRAKAADGGPHGNIGLF